MGTTIGNIDTLTQMGARALVFQDGFTFGHFTDKPFKLHQVYEKPGDTWLVGCGKCGRTTLEVGAGCRFTVIRCPDCGHESCIHDG